MLLLANAERKKVHLETYFNMALRKESVNKSKLVTLAYIDNQEQKYVEVYMRKRAFFPDKEATIIKGYSTSKQHSYFWNFLIARIY